MAHATNAPVAAYGFEDTEAGTTVGDSSIFGNTGTIVGGAVRTAGKHGSGVTFDGTNDRIAIPDAGSINLASGMTLEAWIKPSTVADYRTVVLKERQSDLSYGLYAGPTLPAAYMTTDAGTRMVRTSQLDLNEWVHLAATYDGATFKLFVNGTQAVSETGVSEPMIPGNGPLSIGGNTVYGEYFKGLIDEVRVYDRPLSAAEIQTDMTTPVGIPAPTSPGIPASQQGSWSAPQNWPLVAVHASMLSDGKVVAWDAFDAAPQSEHVWNPETGQFESTPSGINLFCAGHTLLPDGRLFVAGGHLLGYVGLPDTRLFNPLTKNWAAGPNMSVGRWYPTTTTLADGRVLIVSGDGIRPGPNDPFFVRPSDTLPEVYDPKTNTIKAIPQAGRLMPLYPYMFLAPDGRIVDAGPDRTTRFLDVDTGVWTAIASKSPVSGASAVMYRPGKILSTGTWSNTDFGDPDIVNTSAVLDLDQGVPAWRTVAPMKWARTYHNLTVLPDGNVLAIGGQARFGANSLPDSPVLQPEIWNPTTDTWTPMASSVRPRGYHNTSLLLPDGRILLAGSGRLDGSLMVNEQTAEIFSPPYLHKGPRPTISYAPGTMKYGESIEITTPDLDDITKVSLVRIGSVTHQFNMDQRWQELNFRKVGGKLEVDAPTSPNGAPPGVYYVFLLNAQGVPSKAATLSIYPQGTATPDTTAPTAPTGLTATGALSKVTLAWQASTDNVGVTRYVVHRSTTAGFTPTAATKIATVTSGLSYVDDNLAAGTYYYRVIAEDAAGNASAPSAQATGVSQSDTVAPSVPQNLTATGALGKVDLTWSASTDNVAVTRYAVHRSTTSGFTPSAATRIANVTSGTAYADTGLTAGTYYYRVLAEDAAGNASAPSAQAQGAALADTTAPTVSLTAPAAGATVKGSVAVNATATDDVGVAGVQFRLDGANLGAEDTSAPYSVQWDTTTATAGAHTLTAIAKDAAGNTKTAANVAVTVDNSAPSGPTPVAAYAFEEGAGGTTADATGKGHTGTIREATWTAGRNGQALQFDGVNDWVQIADAADLKLTTGMTLQAWVNPVVANNWRTAIIKERPGDLAYALYASGDTYPSIYGTSGSAMASSALPVNTWSHLAATYDGSTYRLYVNGNQVAQAARTNGLTASNGNMYLGGNSIWGEWFRGKLDDVRIYGQALTQAQIQADMGTPVGPPPPSDTTAPSAPQNLAATGALSKVDLTWSASTDNVAVTRYVVHRSTTSGFTPSAATAIANVTSGTSYADTNLAVGTYYYRVVAEDAAGNASAPSAQAQGASLADTTAPSTPTGLTATGALGRVSLSWTAATDNVGVTRYVLHRSTASGFTPDATTRIATVTSGTTYNDTNLPVGTYYYRVLAEDAAGNASAPSAQAQGASLADTTAPTVSVTAPAAGATVKGAVTVTATASDDVGVTEVQFRLDGANLGAVDTSAPYSVQWDTTTASAGPHTLTAIAKDAAGNSKTATDVTVTVDNSAPAGPTPIAAYAFEEASGTTTADATGKGHTGTIREAVRTAGRNGQGLQFDGVNDWVQVTDATDLRITGALTLQAWVNPTKVTNWRTVIMKQRPGDLSYALYSSGDTYPSIYGTEGSALGTGALPANQWSHLAATYDGATYRLYVNGTQVSQSARTNGLAAAAGNLYLGGNSIWGEWFAGKMDDVRIYDKALTPAQIQADMAAPVG